VYGFCMSTLKDYVPSLQEQYGILLVMCDCFQKQIQGAEDDPAIQRELSKEFEAVLNYYDYQIVKLVLSVRTSKRACN